MAELTDRVRIRCHTDGRVAVLLPGSDLLIRGKPVWHIFRDTLMAVDVDDLVMQEGWSELVITEPDGQEAWRG